MRLFAHLRAWRQRRQLELASQHILERTTGKLRRAVADALPTLRPAVARGYVRAMATPLVRAAMDSARLANHEWRQLGDDTLFAVSHERLVRVVLIESARPHRRSAQERRRAA